MRRAMALATPKTDAGPATSSSPQPSKANKVILRVFFIGKKKHMIVISARAKFGYSRRSSQGRVERCPFQRTARARRLAIGNHGTDPLRPVRRHERNAPDQQ